MSQVRIELVPLHAAVCSDTPTTLDVLLKITPLAPVSATGRPSRSLVHDRSGSPAAFGNAVTLSVEPANGVNVIDVFNDYEATPNGHLKLPSLIANMPVIAAIRLEVAPQIQTQIQVRELCRFRIEWTAPGPIDSGPMTRQSAVASLNLPSVSGSLGESLAENVEVQEKVALLRIARRTKLVQASESVNFRKSATYDPYVRRQNGTLS